VDTRPTIEAVGFPPPLLGEFPQRLAVLDQGADHIVLDKGAGIAVRQHPWHETAGNLDAALNLQLEAGKAELAATGAELFGSIYHLDGELAGPVVFGLNRSSVSGLRNAHGSGAFTFTFEFVARPLERIGRNEKVVADAPLLVHRAKPKLIPSTAKGKKARTEFRMEGESSFGWSLWSARTFLLRPHQTRAHAALLGIPAMGDGLYGGEVAPTLADIRPKARGQGVRRPLFQGVAMRLSRVSFENGGIEVEAPRPKSFMALLRRLGLEEGRAAARGSPDS